MGPHAANQGGAHAGQTAVVMGAGCVGLVPDKSVSDKANIVKAAVSLLMLLSRLWDATLIGSLSDRTNTRWGRYRPWPLIGAPLTALVLALTFWAHPTWGHVQNGVYVRRLLPAGIGLHLRQHPLWHPVRGTDPEH